MIHLSDLDNEDEDDDVGIDNGSEEEKGRVCGENNDKGDADRL